MLKMKPSILQVRGLGVEEGPEEAREKKQLWGDKEPEEGGLQMAGKDDWMCVSLACYAKQTRVPLILSNEP